jgi:RNA polymerase sigma-70 factor (ECF subfamily)
MSMSDASDRLSRISTQWTMVFQAHDGEAAIVTAAQRQWLERYSGAIYRYLLGAVRDPQVAEELAQELAFRFVRGDFRKADPGRGRFRDYLKTALIHLVTDHHRAQQARPRQLGSEIQAPPSPIPPSVDAEADFVTHWRQELLDRTWKALAAAQPDYHALLLFRVENPEGSSADAAAQLSARLGRPITAAAVRKGVQRAHGKFAELLLTEVEQSLGSPTTEELTQELRELDMLKYCRSALQRRADP